MSQSPQEPTTDTRQRLLDAAEALFARRGLAGTSVREITEAAGANLAAINYHFRSKENLYIEVFLRRMAQMRDPVIAASRVAAPLARRNAHEALLTVGRA